MTKKLIILLVLVFPSMAIGQSVDHFNGGYVHWWNVNDVNDFSVKGSPSMTETWSAIWPIYSGDANDVLCTTGDQANAQWYWATVENEPNQPWLLPERTPWCVIFVDANGYPLWEDPNNFTYYEPETAFGIGLDNIAAGTYANNYIQVYTLLDFDPNLLNVTIGRGIDDTVAGANDVTIGNSAGYGLTVGKQNTFGGNFSGYSVGMRDDDTFYGFESGKNVGGGLYTSDPDNYKYTYFSEGSGYLWGVPLGDGTNATLDNGGAAADEGGGIVSIPFTGNPFIEDDVIYLSGTSSYNGTHTLTAGTTTSELQFADTFSAETFDGTETVVKYVDLTGYGNGLGGVAGQDATGVLYYPIIDSLGTHWIIIIQPDGSMALDTWTWPASYDGVRDAVISNDGNYLYVKTSGPVNIIKFEISTGTAIWYMDTTKLRADPLITYALAVFNEYDTLGIDLDGNAYTSITNASNGKQMVQLDADDGSVNYKYTNSGELSTSNVLRNKYSNVVDNDNGIVISGGLSQCLTSQYGTYQDQILNLWVKTFDGSNGDAILVGDVGISGSFTSSGQIATNHVVLHNGYIYVLKCNYSTPAHKVYIYEWTGSEMSLVNTIDFAGHMPSEACGIFFDLWDNMVIVNNDPIDGYGDGTFWYYDKDGNYITTITGFNILMLNWWNATAGWAYTRGNTLFYPGINNDYTYSGDKNTVIGSQALYGASAGAEPNEATAGGYKSLYSVTTPDLPTAYGAYSGYGVTTADRGIYLGPYAGYNQTTDPNRFVLDSWQRESEADEAASSLFYGYIAADANDSWLDINADVNMPKTVDVNELEVDELTVTGLTASSVIFVDPNGNISDDSQNNANFSWDDTNHTLDVNQVDVNNVAVIKPDSAVFQPNADSTTFFQVLDADGGTPVLNVDSDNERVGVRTASPAYPFAVNYDGTNQIGFSIDGGIPALTWNSGGSMAIVPSTANTQGNVFIRGTGTGYGSFRVYNAGNSNYFECFASGSSGYFAYGGSSPQRMHFDYTATLNDINFFAGAASGETKEFKVYGYRAGDASRSLEIGVGIDAADTASFDGLSNYLFDGNIYTPVGASGGMIRLSQDESTDAALDALGEVHIRGDEDRFSAHVGAGGEIAGEVTRSFLDMCSITVDPGSWYDSNDVLPLFKVQAKKFPNGIIIDYWEVDCLLDPDVEMNMNLGFSNDWDDVADPNLVDVLDTTNGKSSEDTDSNIYSGAAIPAGSALFLYWDADPEGTCTAMKFEMLYHAEED